MPARGPVTEKPKPRTKKKDLHQLTVDIERPLYMEIRRVAEQQDLFLRQVVEWGLREYLRQYGGASPRKKT